jgi:DNA primase
MNSSEAKRIPLSDILGQLGYDPHHEAKGDMWYFSPFREETVPSFKINLERNIWYDFGAGEGGNILDFILKYYHLATIAEALGQLEGLTRDAFIAPAASAPAVATETVGRDPTEGKIEVLTTKFLTNRALIAYLNQRGIAAATARPFVKEGYYTVNGSYNQSGRPFFALAFPNNSGGYELRNKYFKGSSNKDISLVQASGPGDEIAVFEGFMDFLSALTWYGPQQFTRPTIVLNAVSMRDRAIAAIKQRQPGQVTLYLDRDQVGRELTTFFGEQLADIPIVDASDLYAGYKDFNEFLVAHTAPKQR